MGSLASTDATPQQALASTDATPQQTLPQEPVAEPVVHVPVLESILSQSQKAGLEHDEWQKAAKWLLWHWKELKVKPTDAQWIQLQRLAGRLSPVVLRLLAAPGCGKTLFCLMLLHGLCQADKENGIHRCHFMTAPTKNLVSELVEAARLIFPEEWLAPVGSMPDGSERFVNHQQALAFAEFKGVWDAFEARRIEVKEIVEKVKISWYGYVQKDENFEEAKNAVKQLHLDRFDFYYGDELQAAYEKHESSVRLALCTTTYKLKHNANKKGALQRIFRQPGVLPGGHVCDEADMVAFGPLVATVSSDEFLLLPNDPTQHMRDSQSHCIGREYKSLARAQNPNDWLEFADYLSLSETRRFGHRIKNLLKEMFPKDYGKLECHPQAPYTTLTVYDCGYLDLEQVIPRAGGAVDPRLLAHVGMVIDKLIARQQPVMLICIYATLREILAAYLQDSWGAEVNTVLPGGYQDEHSLWVCSARQTRGGTRPITVTVFVRRFAWDKDYEAHALDKGKQSVCVSRATEEEIIIAEHWQSRPYDALHRMMDYAWKHRHEDGCDYYHLNNYWEEHGSDWDDTAYDERIEEAHMWIENEGWTNYITYDSDDEDPTAVEYFSTPDKLWQETQTKREKQERSWDIPRYQDVKEVDKHLWDHVKSLVVATTVRADFEQETKTNSDDEGWLLTTIH